MSVPCRVAAITIAATLTLIVASPAVAATGVYGGSTSDGEAIVLTTDAKGEKLRSAVIAWEAECDDGTIFPWTIELRPVPPQPGSSPPLDELEVSRNAKGRFAGAQLIVLENGDLIADFELTMDGKLRPGRASGTMAATVVIADAATGATQTTCTTGRLRWSATRDPGRVFGGKTAQDEPVVARLDRKRKRVTELLMGWASDTCKPPENYFRFGERFRQLTVRGGRFGRTFDEFYPSDDGSAITIDYRLSGSVSRRSIRGEIQVAVTGTDAAGATTLSCDSGAVRWKAATG